MDDDLLETLRDAQRFGFFGDRPVEEAAAHSMGFVDAIGVLDPGARLVDMGSGGGLPGLLLARCYPAVSITLVDRRQTRADFLRRASRRLGLEHVRVVTDDVARLAQSVTGGAVLPFDVVTARGFGPPIVTLRFGADLMSAGGQIVISDPPSTDRWDPDLVEQLGLDRRAVGSMSVFQRRDPPT